MTLSLLGSPWRTLLLVGLSLAGIAVTVRAERSSEARANRLHRSGLLSDAAALYDARLLEDSSAARLRYNLGTTLLRLGSSAASTELAAGSETENERLRVRALYNMGLWSLIQAVLAQTNDSILFHAGNAVEENKRALRLDPEHPDAPWNLALAQMMLVTAVPEEGPGNSETPEGAPDIEGLQLSDDLRELDEDELFEDAPEEGEEEALADDEDLEPLSMLEASEILGRGHLDPSTIISKLLLREGRSRRRQRTPVVGTPW